LKILKRKFFFSVRIWDTAIQGLNQGRLKTPSSEMEACGKFLGGKW